VSLNAFLQKRREYQWRWGLHDCATFAARGMAAATGYDPLASISWTSSKAALRLLRRYKPADFLVRSERLTAQPGWVAELPSFAPWPCVWGVVIGNGLIAVAQTTGWQAYPIAQAKAFWGPPPCLN